MECRKCHAPLKERDRFCGQCGSLTIAVTHACTNCGCIAKATDRFCFACGAKIMSASAVASAPGQDTNDTPAVDNRKVETASTTVKNVDVSKTLFLNTDQNGFQLGSSEVQLPPFLARHLPATSKFYLIAGTYSGISRNQLGTPPNSITTIALRFQSFLGQELSFTSGKELPMGTMDPSAFQSSTNSIVVGIVQTDQAGLVAVAMWVPDGMGGQYTVEQAYFFLKNWLVSKAQINKQMAQIAVGTAAMTAVGVTLGPLGFIVNNKIKKKFVEHVQKEDENYDRLDTITTPRLMRDFGHWLMEGGYFQRAFDAARPQSSTNGSGRL